MFTLLTLPTGLPPLYTSSIYATPGNYTLRVPPGVRQIRAVVIGAGGAGGDSAQWTIDTDDFTGGGGGGGGGGGVVATLNVTGNLTLNITVASPVGYQQLQTSSSVWIGSSIVLGTSGASGDLNINGAPIPGAGGGIFVSNWTQLVGSAGDNGNARDNNNGGAGANTLVGLDAQISGTGGAGGVIATGFDGTGVGSGGGGGAWNAVSFGGGAGTPGWVKVEWGY